MYQRQPAKRVHVAYKKGSNCLAVCCRSEAGRNHYLDVELDAVRP